MDTIHCSTFLPMKVIKSVQKSITSSLLVCLSPSAAFPFCVQHFFEGLTKHHMNYSRSFPRSENDCTRPHHLSPLKQPEEVLLAPILALLLYSAAYTMFIIKYLSALCSERYFVILLAPVCNSQSKLQRCSECVHRSLSTHACGKCSMLYVRVRASPIGCLMLGQFISFIIHSATDCK